MQALSRWTLSWALGAAFAAFSIADAAVACARSAMELGASGVLAALALGASLGVLVGVGIACTTELPLRALTHALTRSLTRAPKLTRPLAFGLLAVLAGWLAFSFALGIDFQRIELRALDRWMVIVALSFAPVTWLCLLILRRREPAAALALTLWTWGALVLGAGGAMGFSSSSPHARSLALAAFDDSSVVVKPLLQRASRALDGDRDGHPRILCGQACDCDDHDATVHALAIDIPGNGRDEDCDGRDATKAELSQLTRAFAKDESAPPQAAAITRPPDVLLIVVDTLRADHLGLYGYPRATSPRIDALGKRAVVFEQARSTGPSTRFSMPAMLTSKWFTEIKRNNFEWPAISESEYLLGERLRDLGYTLAAFHSIRYFRSYFKLGQGFDHWSVRALDERGPELPMISSDLITDEALAWVDAQGDKLAGENHKPFLLWAYYGDPHAEYMRHPGFASFGNEYVDRYDGEIAFTDHHVGRLLDGLEQRGLTDNLLVILTSDHGEALDVKADHGALNHSKHIYDELVHVPMLIAGPALTPRRVRTPVSLIDILPTLLGLGAAGDPRGRDETLRGVSLTPWLRGAGLRGEASHPPVFFEKHRAIDDPQKGMLAWPYKVIVTVPTGRTQIYDIASDPHEQRDLYSSIEASERDRLVGMLKHWAANVLKPARDNWRH